ncbi:DUF4242 domain-containing protein [Rhodobacteraceae bacterium KMS-5]|uniref:DUF4242 domain-containing protein n=2 Tax=Tabrizicola oligotrophica TaxID=2710650 RepID=A0A6M0QXN9_9RHOB|nr:DUF4242 domain-containing protein [Tabrizicola oligotrophica]
MKRYIIEREVPGMGAMSLTELCGAARASNQALAQLAPRVQWNHSYVAADKTFCIYLAEDEDAVRDHARLSGFPATKITEIPIIIDPTTANN